MRALWLFTILVLAEPAAAQNSLTVPAAKYYREAQDSGYRFAEAGKLQPDKVHPNPTYCHPHPSPPPSRGRESVFVTQDDNCPVHPSGCLHRKGGASFYDTGDEDNYGARACVMIEKFRHLSVAQR